MATKATKKTRGKKPEQTQTAAAAAFSSTVNLGPPFAGQGPYYGGAWGRFPANPDGRIVPCPGFWGALGRSPTTGGIVAQLGAEPATGAASCTLYAGFQYVFRPTVGGEHVIVLTMNLGPISRAHRYGRVQVAGVLQIMGPGGHWADFYDDLPSNTGITLVIRPRIQAGGTYTLRFGVAPIVTNAGRQSYGEAILHSATLTQYLPYGVPAEPAAEAHGLKAAASSGVLSALFDQNQQPEAEDVSLHEAASMGVVFRQ